MTDENEKHPAEVYLDTLQEVGNVFLQRAPAEGDPELFGSTFAGLLESYVGPVLQVRRLAAVDAFVVMSLVEAARLVAGGPQAQRFRDMMTAALAGSVHVERVVAQANASRVARAPAAAPEDLGDDEARPAYPAPLTLEEGAEWPTTGKPGQYVYNGRGVLVGSFDFDGRFIRTEEPDASAKEREAERADLGRPELDEARARIAADEERADDADLLRWVLDPGSDPWADLLDDKLPQIGDKPSKRALRPGVTQADVQTRAERLHGLLDTRKPPQGVSATDWRAARMRAMPETFGDLPPA